MSNKKAITQEGKGYGFTYSNLKMRIDFSGKV